MVKKIDEGSSWDKRTASGAIVLEGKDVEQEGYDEQIEKLNKSISQTKKEFDDFKKEQNIKLIEFLGIFTAVLAFITISGKIVIDNLNTINILILLPAFAILLMLFVLTIDSIIVKESKKWIWKLLAILVIVEGFLIWFSFKQGWLLT